MHVEIDHILSFYYIILFFAGLGQNRSRTRLRVWCTLHRSSYCTTPSLASKWYNHFLHQLVLCMSSFWLGAETETSLMHAGEEDPRCPLAGLDIPKQKVAEAYENAGCKDKFKVWTILISSQYCEFTVQFFFTTLLNAFIQLSLLSFCYNL